MADDNIRHVNYASDFRVVFSFPDGKLPDYPWHIELKTPDTPAYNTYVASFDGSVYRRCVPLEDNSILVLVDRHHLAPGILCYQMKRDVPDSLFPDGEMNITTPGCTSIELWSGTSEELPIEQINTIIATLKGEPGDAGQIENITASVNNTTGAPNVEVQLGGTPEKRTIALKFSGIKGETPKISADEEGNIYSDGELVTAVVAEVVVKADTASTNADQQAARAKSLADHPPKIVDVGGLKYWAFWDDATKGYVTSEYRADDGTIVQQVEGSAVSLDVRGGTMYVCGELTSLNIASVENSTKPSIIRFTSGATATQFSFPEDFNITGWSKPEENKRYTICILFGAGNMTYDE
jgi:hypothetical protein